MYPDLANAPMATNPSSIEVVLVPTRDFDEWERVSYPTDGGELTLDMSVATMKGNEVIVFSPTIIDMGSEYYQFRDSFTKAAKTLSDN